MTKAAVQNNRMDKRRLATRAKLLAAAERLVVEKGVDATTMDDISALADLGRRTIYNHFDSKDECVIAAASHVFARHTQATDDVMDIDLDPALVISIGCHIALKRIVDEPFTRQLVDRPRFLAEALSEAVTQFVERDIQRGLESGRFRSPLKEGRLDGMMKWSLVGIIVQMIEEGGYREEHMTRYAHTVLMILGLPYEEAESVAVEAGLLARELIN